MIILSNVLFGLRLIEMRGFTIMLNFIKLLLWIYRERRLILILVEFFHFKYIFLILSKSIVLLVLEMHIFIYVKALLAELVSH
jgi:hypothetical protein